jgi:serine/threonine protein kinase/Tol biopolymer transport system component
MMRRLRTQTHRIRSGSRRLPEPRVAVESPHVTIGPGSRLGSYEVIALIGEGGMGKVWRAHHIALNRDDALKVLPDAFASDPDRLARFRREAQVLASLNHPNIAHVYGLEQADGTQALVMELVEGETLADRIARGPIPVDEALLIGKQIAEALEAAHEQGIIHRDLKPSNIKLRSDGGVKVLDFGLAKALEPVAATGQGGTLSPTITSPAMMTGVGVLLGTAAYMSPEQAKGRPADRRSDIWAFGCVLYEMLVGRRPFMGDDITETIAAVVKEQPDWNALPAGVSPTLRAYLRRCLHKDPKERVGDIRDVRLALAGAFDVPASPKATQPSRLAVLRQAWPWMAAAVIVSAGVTTVVLRTLMNAPAQQPVRRLEHMLPRSLELLPGAGTLLALSPDGQTLIYRARQNGVWRAYRRALDELQAQPVAGTENLNSDAFVSADGRWVGFTLGSDLMKVSLVGGRPVRVSELPAPQQRGSSWGSDNSIFVGANQRGLLRIPATGGKPQVLVAPEGGRQYWYPQVLPGGRAVLFTSSLPARDAGDVFALDLATGMTKMVIRDGVAGRYVTTGHLVFLRGGDLWAVPFDRQQLAISGDPVVVEQGIRVEAGGAVQFALANDGTLAYIPAGNNDTPRKLVWVDRAGKEEPLPAPERAYLHPRISPDGGRVAVDAADQEADIWLWNLRGQTFTRLTFGSELEASPVWWPDGRSLIFASGLAAGTNIFRQAADGTGSVERVTEGETGKVPTSVAPGGTDILLREVAPNTGVDLGRLRVSPTSPQKWAPPTPLVRTTFSERNGEVSPGGQWLAYESDESGRLEIYVRPFPDVNGGRWQVSTNGGRMPLWSRDGKELFYLSPDGAMMVSRVEAGRTWVAATPVQLFRGDYLVTTGANTRTFDIAPDGERFLMVKDIQTANAPQASIVVVEHFDEVLKRLVPTK